MGLGTITRLAAVLLGSAPAAAATEAGGIPLGRVEAFPAPLMSLTHDDNVYPASDDPTGDRCTTVAHEARAIWERRTSSFATFEYDDTRLWASARAAF